MAPIERGRRVRNIVPRPLGPVEISIFPFFYAAQSQYSIKV